MLKREKDKTWLDLDSFYPPPHKHPNTVFKSMAIAFQAMGSAVTYVDLMGVSTAAFRIQVGGSLCPSSPHPHLGFSCAEFAREALGFALKEHEWDGCKPETIEKVKKTVVESVERGEPMLTVDEETGLAVGYAKNGEEILVRDPYSKKGDGPATLSADWAGWGMSEIAELPRSPSGKNVVRSIETAVRLARTTKADAYFSGFAAFDYWTTSLRDEKIIEHAETDAEAVIVGNAHIYYCLVDARRCAAAYLDKTGSKLPGAADHLEKAAALYVEIADKLDTGWENVPWPWKLESASDWTAEQRRKQAALLDEVLEIERAAIASLESALDAAR